MEFDMDSGFWNVWTLVMYDSHMGTIEAQDTQYSKGRCFTDIHVHVGNVQGTHVLYLEIATG